MTRNKELLITSFLAGMCIALGGTVFLRIKDAFPGGQVVGALLFTVGLFVVCTRSYTLYTGKVCYIFDNSPRYLLDIGIIWLGNLLGTGFFALMEQSTILCGNQGINLMATTMVEQKIANSEISLIILGAICNIFIFIAVNGYAKNPHIVGKYLALFLGVACFILCGTEHSIADMYYFWISGYFVQEPLHTLICLMYISLGNLLGGVLIPVLEKQLSTNKKVESTLLNKV